MTPYRDPSGDTVAASALRVARIDASMELSNRIDALIAPYHDTSVVIAALLSSAITAEVTRRGDDDRVRAARIVHSTLGAMLREFGDAGSES